MTLQNSVPSPKRPSPPSSSASSEEEEENPKKPTSDLYQTPNSDSSSEEDSDSSSEEEDNEEEEESENETVVKPQPTEEEEEEESKNEKVVKPQSTKEEEEDSDEGSDSDSDNHSAHPSPNVKPIPSKSVEGAPKPKMGASSPTVAAAAAAAAVAKPSSHKLSNEKESKKRQKPDLGAEDEGSSAKKPLFQRIWSPENEISLLKAMIEFRTDFSYDLTEIHEFINKSLNVDMNKNQVAEKIRRMRRKYQKLEEKGKQPAFYKAHDNLVHQLSKQIWGNDGEGENSVQKSRNSKRRKDTIHQTVHLKSPSPPKSSSCYPYLNDLLHSGGIVSVAGFGESDVKRALALMGDSRAKEWDDRWMKLRSKEKEIYMERASLVYELMKECYYLDKPSKKS